MRAGTSRYAGALGTAGTTSLGFGVRGLALGFTFVAFVFAPVVARAQAPVACFAEGTDPAAVAPLAPDAAMAALAPQAASRSKRWEFTAQDPTTGGDGDPITLTWGVVADGTTIVPASSSQTGQTFPSESSDPSSLEAHLDLVYGTRDAWMALFRDVFDRWDEVSGVRFVEVADDGADIQQSGSLPGVIGMRPDIRIGGHFIDGDSGVVAYAYPPNTGDIVLDTGDSFFDASLRLRNALAHEVGHALGLQHVCPTSQEKLMEPIVGSFLDGPQADDIIGVTAYYGDALENDDGFGSSTDFGFGIGEGAVVLDMSIDGSGDEDWSVIPDEPGLRISVTVDPLAAPYVYSAANSGNVGSCADSSGVVVDTAIAQDLAIELVAADGSTSIVFRDFTPAGGSETLSNYPVEGGGFVRIVGDGASDPQLYDLVVQYVPEPGSGLGAGAGLATVMLLRRRRRGRS